MSIPSSDYHRYHIETIIAPNLSPHPHRFHVSVNKVGLAKLLLKEIVHYKGKLAPVSSRPCMYGVFSGPIGGFAPREHLCVGCLRCTVQYPEIVSITRNPERLKLGDSYFLPDSVDTIVYEAETGRVPVRGAGYRGKFGGEGWEGMWTDMSEIVRPARDGIHGREYISTEVDIGGKPHSLSFDRNGEPQGEVPHSVKAPLPILFDPPPGNSIISGIASDAAAHVNTFAFLPLNDFLANRSNPAHCIPIVSLREVDLLLNTNLPFRFIEMEEWNDALYRKLCSAFPKAVLILRTPFESDSIKLAYQAGMRAFHLCADYHGRGKSGAFVLDMIRNINEEFVQMHARDRVSLIGSGGIIAADHLPKAILCGLDAVALDTTILVALQANCHGEWLDRHQCVFCLPPKITHAWGVQRLKNLCNSWRDQLLEIMGAMGLREVRRLRGELGRAMFQKDLETEAFQGIDGYGR